MSSSEAISAVVEFTPSEAMKAAKARFWAQQSSSWRPVESLSVAEISAQSGVSTVRSWMQNPKFVSWFLNKDFARQKLAAEAETAIQVLVDTLNAPVSAVTTVASKLKAAELLLTFGGYKPTQKIEQTTKISAGSNLDADQLREALQTQVRSLLSRMTPEQMIEVIGQDNLAKLGAIPASVEESQ